MLFISYLIWRTLHMQDTTLELSDHGSVPAALVAPAPLQLDSCVAALFNNADLEEVAYWEERLTSSVHSNTPLPESAALPVAPGLSWNRYKTQQPLPVAPGLSWDRYHYGRTDQ